MIISANLLLHHNAVQRCLTLSLDADGVTNITYNTELIQADTLATYTCENGIDGDSGDTRTCMCNGNWSMEPICAEGK